jgi:hypothetical protein
VWNPATRQYDLFAGYNEGSWTRNPATELAAYRLVFRTAELFGGLLGVDAADRERWRIIYEHLPPQPLTADGQAFSLAEEIWLGPGNLWNAMGPMSYHVPGDGNALSLETVIPGGQYGWFSPPEDLRLMQNTIDLYHARNAWRMHNNFPKLYTFAVRTRYSPEAEPNRLLTRFAAEIAYRIQPNLRISDGAHGVEKTGATEAVNSMLLQGHEGVVTLFPFWRLPGTDTASRPASFGRLRAPGGFVVSASYDGTRIENGVTVFSTAGKAFTLAHPWQGESSGITVVNCAGETVPTTQGAVPNWDSDITFTFETVPGAQYRISPSE